MTSPLLPGTALLPGSVIGILGSGQLGRMLALAARPMGYRIHVFSPGSDTPAGRVADHEHDAPYENLQAVRAFARKVDVVTFEFENVPAATAETAAAEVPVRPAGKVLHVAQNRLREKTFLADNGFPVAPFRRVRGESDLAAAVTEVGTPAVLKSAGWGYDGKGQAMVGSLDEAVEAWRNLSVAGREPEEGVLEAFVEFEREVSVVGARGLDGDFTHWGVMANDHENHILDVTVAPAPVGEAVVRRAVELARGIFEALEVVGVLCVEMFQKADGELLVNELAPRPHNSGHLTIEAAPTSQFEQQARAVCGLPLGATEPLRPAAMANILGDLWHRRRENTGDSTAQPDWAAALAIPGVKLHLYGKADPRPGRKMGHLTAVAGDVEEARRKVLTARRALTP